MFEPVGTLVLGFSPESLVLNVFSWNYRKILTKDGKQPCSLNMCADRKNESVPAEFIVFADNKNSRHLAYSKGLYLLEGHVGHRAKVTWAVGAQAVFLLPLPSPFFLFFFDTCPLQLEFILCGHWMLLNL